MNRLFADEALERDVRFLELLLLAVGLLGGVLAAGPGGAAFSRWASGESERSDHIWPCSPPLARRPLLPPPLLELLLPPPTNMSAGKSWSRPPMNWKFSTTTLSLLRLPLPILSSQVSY